jgi:hypothetical protein
MDKIIGGGFGGRFRVFVFHPLFKLGIYQAWDKLEELWGFLWIRHKGK